MAWAWARYSQTPPATTASRVSTSPACIHRESTCTSRLVCWSFSRPPAGRGVPCICIETGNRSTKIWPPPAQPAVDRAAPLVQGLCPPPAGRPASAGCPRAAPGDATRWSLPVSLSLEQPMREPSSVEESAATHPSRAAGSLRIVPVESRASGRPSSACPAPLPGRPVLGGAAPPGAAAMVRRRQPLLRTRRGPLLAGPARRPAGGPDQRPGRPAAPGASPGRCRLFRPARAEDADETFRALLATAEDWLRARGLDASAARST